jgi:hypothetical protein
MLVHVLGVYFAGLDRKYMLFVDPSAAKNIESMYDNCRVMLQRVMEAPNGRLGRYLSPARMLE